MGDFQGTIDQVLTRLVPQTVNDLMDFQAPSDSNATSGKSRWAWWVGGGVVAVGGAAAAVLLLKGSGSPAGTGRQRSGHDIPYGELVRT